MKVKCKYCDSLIDDTYTNCPNCGAALDTVQRFANKQPQTIEELQKWYMAMKLPPEEVTRFFIGKDIKEPRAFGIYKDAGGDFVVYNNKSDGSRAVRYHGSDEAYAVNEIYQRLKGEIANQKSHNADRRMQQAKDAQRAYQSGQTNTRRKRRRSSLATIVFVIVMVNMVSSMLIAVFSTSYRNTASVPRPAAGYYSYDGADYYRQGNDWYYYDESGDDWGHTVEENIPEAVANDIEGQYHIDGEGHEGIPFEDTFWYHEPSTSTYNDYDSGYDSYNSYDNDSYDWDDDYGWDSNDSWDSYDSDWDSDW